MVREEKGWFLGKKGLICPIFEDFYPRTGRLLPLLHIFSAEFFGEHKPLKEVKTFHVKQVRNERQLVVENGTVKREFSLLSGIFRVQVELENIDYNPCAGIRGLPAKQRDTYLSFVDFNSLLEHSW